MPVPFHPSLAVQVGPAVVSTVTALAVTVDGNLVTGSADSSLGVWRNGFFQPAIVA